MFGLTSLGTLHTAFGLVAFLTGLFLLARYGAITVRRPLASVYLWGTALTCLTGFGIFQRGGFNIAHVLGIVTLVVLVAAVAAGRLGLFGKLAPYVETVGFTATVFFHMIPGITETFTRFPLGAPLFANPEDPNLQKTIGGFFLLFALIMLAQIWKLRRTPPAGRQPHPA